ncbi:MAG: tRNA (adenosine(37)-N6)-dimethylallyltransferase MiaA [Deltaproteobacteria bacterium]|nr:tRNA (adenosine(37)-N6)-dimethylallyltransferase MiaA [Deltaproteobacteria bacterium]
MTAAPDQAGGESVVVVTGPTASGKSSLAISLAERFTGEVVNADSMQVYRYMDVGTAKPSLEERARVAHHLFDVVTPDVDYNAARYGVEARATVDEIHRAGRVAFLTGGTGLYIRAFLYGLTGIGGADPELRERLEGEHARASAEGDPERLHRRLAELDPAAAEKIHANDLRRTIRALEIIEASGTSATSARDQFGFQECPYRVLHLALDPGVEILNRRIDLRCAEMIEGGLLQEVRRLRGMGYGPQLRPMQAIGYRHVNTVVDGHDTLANALVEMQKDTRRFARRQRTWLRKVPDAVWLDPGAEDAVIRRVEDFLAC